MSYLNLIMLSRTCKRFFVLVIGIERFKKAEFHMKNVFNMKAEYSFFAHFRSEFKFLFCNHFSGYANFLHLKWFMSIFLEQLNERLLFAHVYWCRRNSNDEFSCQYCRPVRRCMTFDYTESNTVAVFSLKSYGRWDEDFIKFFENDNYYSPEINKMYKSCLPRDFIWCYNQLLNYFAKIAVRIFINIGKKHLFFSKFNQKFFYDCYLEQTRYLFSSVISNFRKTYIKEAVEKLVPFRDYDSTYLIICNNYYIQYKKQKSNKRK